MNILILELKIYCGPDKFYGRSNFGQYDEVNDRAPLPTNLSFDLESFNELGSYCQHGLHLCQVRSKYAQPFMVLFTYLPVISWTFDTEINRYRVHSLIIGTKGAKFEP